MERRTPAPCTALVGSGMSASAAGRTSTEGWRFLRSSRPSSSAPAAKDGGSAVAVNAARKTPESGTARKHVAGGAGAAGTAVATGAVTAANAAGSVKFAHSASQPCTPRKWGVKSAKESFGRPGSNSVKLRPGGTI